MLIFEESTVMRRRAAILVIVFFHLIFMQVVAAQVRTGITPVSELTPLPLSQQLSTMREPIPVETILDAALGFSGASDAAAGAAKDRLSGLLVKFRGEVADINDQAALAEKALTFLHKNLFTNYSVLQTRVDTALETGVFNCVSSAVLYMILARSVGLSVGGVRTPDHAFCSVLVNGQQLDVETTNPYGFNPGAKKDFTDSFGRLTGYTYVPPGNYSDRRSIGEKELLSLILYNRVSEYMDGRFFRDALQPAVSAFVLMGTDDTLQVMKLAFTNYITWLETRQDFPTAIQFTDTVKASFGGIVNLDGPRRETFRNWVVTLIDARSLSDADALLSQAATRAALDDADWTALSVAVVQRLAEAEVDNGGNLAAAGVVADALKRIGRHPALLQTYEAYVHNAFAMLLNARKRADAKAVIDQGLTIYPDSRMLQQDLDLARKAIRDNRS
jgi:hypothetical protein